MNIKIYRGTKQIGGSAVEISTKKARIFIDFGAELTENSKKLSIDGVTKGKTNCDAIFFSHNHGDHVGCMDDVNEDIPLYIGEDAKYIMMMLAERTKNRMHNYDRVKKMKSYKVNVPIKIKDITITPYFVDHSAFDAYMFVIEADGKKILYTGDFRGHAYLSKGLFPTLKKYVKNVDAIICEGTTLNRPLTKLETERDLQEKFKKVIRDNKYIFVICSSTNIYRIAGICNATGKNKYIITDEFQDKVNKYITAKYKMYDLYNGMKRSTCYNRLDRQKYIDKGFVAFIRTGKFGSTMLKMFPGAKIIYSMWKGYLDNNKNKDLSKLLKGKKYDIMHTSGHADLETIKKVIKIINPKKVIPIHTEAKEKFKEFVEETKLMNTRDYQAIEITR